MAFTLHTKLAEDTVVIGDMRHCRVLLMDNRTFPWLVLVPMRDGLRELYDLPAREYQAVMAEVRYITQRFAIITEAHKMNVAALGNMVPQLHIHIIARHMHDAAWPQPVWNHPEKAQAYGKEELKEMIETLSRRLFPWDSLAQASNITKM
jgi:diadenosine tetraphosphate (Ap4A) HIT family hydrolase